MFRWVHVTNFIKDNSKFLFLTKSYHFSKEYSFSTLQQNMLQAILVSQHFAYILMYKPSFPTNVTLRVCFWSSAAILLEGWWLIVWCLTLLSTEFQLYRCGQCTYPCFPGVLLSSTTHNILSKPLAAFPHNHCQNDGHWWERTESCRNNYRQSLERILLKRGIKPTTSCSQVCNTTDWAMGLGAWRL